MLNLPKIVIGCFFLCFLQIAWASNEALLTDLTVKRTSTSPPETQIIFTLNQTTGYKAFMLPIPPRLVVDLPNTRYAFLKGKSVNLSDTDISDFRHGIHKGYNLRMVFDLREARHYAIETPHDNPFQVVITLSPASHLPSSPLKTQNVGKKEEANISLAKISADTTPILLENASSPAKENVVSPVSPDKKLISQPEEHLKKHKFIVVIDAGHGGKDPGAEGPGGTEEKNITLAIAKDVQQLVRAHPGMKAVLTRQGDYYVGLRQRLLIARRAKGDIFVAIHADAFNEPDAEGASVFALSLHGATSEAGLWLAKKENYSELGGIDLNDIQDQDGQIRSVLIDLSQTATIGASLQLGQNVIKQLGKITDLHHGVVEQAPFMVLKSPDIPSILVETGFISNPKEEARLKTDAYQEKIAKAIMAGIDAYYEKNVQKTVPDVIFVNKF